ncbi:MAG: translation elongation factor Ts [Planctomycetota bacterium]|jgi:elongation factor Ts
MAIDAKLVKELRDRTGLPMMQCKNALSETDGNLDKAEEYLAKQGAKIAEKKAGRETKEGTIGFYIHHDKKTAVMVELLCETDFVAKNEEFQALAKDLAMHVAFHDPVAARREEVPEKLLEKERGIILGQLEQDPKMKDKPDQVKEKIAEGKLNKFYAERVLLEQPFVKDTSGKTSVKALIEQIVLKLRENISVGRFLRLKIGEE